MLFLHHLAVSGALRERPRTTDRVVATRGAGAERRDARATDRGDAVLMRRSDERDAAALERLAALDSRELPTGSFLLAEVDGDLVAAHPLDSTAPPVADPFRFTAAVLRLLEVRARQLA